MFLPSSRPLALFSLGTGLGILLSLLYVFAKGW